MDYALVCLSPSIGAVVSLGPRCDQEGRGNGGPSDMFSHDNVTLGLLSDPSLIEYLQYTP